MNLIRIFLFIFLASGVLSSAAQVTDSGSDLSIDLPEKYYSKVNKKLSSINEQLSKKSVKYLSKFEKKDRKIRKKLRKLNPENILSGSDEKYNEFIAKVKTQDLSGGAGRMKGMLPNKSPPATSDNTESFNLTGEYNPYIDSLNTSLNFLDKFDGVKDKVKEPLASLHNLQSSLQQSEKIKEFIAARKNQIKEVLSKYTKLPKGLKGQYDKSNKTAYYYSAQVKEYKELLNNPKKIEQKALGMLNKVPAFQKFMKENGQLASLFRLPGNEGTTGSLTGLQTRTAVQGMIQQRIAAGGPNAQAQIQANMAAAHAELNKLKDKMNMLSEGGGDIDMPRFKPNNQKTKAFFKRLEYTADVQFGKSNNVLPSNANIGLGIGYKLDDKRIIGIGGSYKIGIGSIQHISFTSQGLGVRSYLDWKIKKQLYASGGYEMNYNRAFKNIEQLKHFDAWQRTALVGLSKKYKISKKVKGEMKILYDILANQHTPVSQSIIFRLGYKF